MHTSVVNGVSRAEQTTILPFDDRIALAHPRFQLGTIEYGDVAAAAMDQSRLLQLSSGSFEGNRSRQDKIQRHICCSSEWCRLHTAICAVCAISA